jgi:flavin-binding protein dodecin
VEQIALWIGATLADTQPLTERRWRLPPPAVPPALGLLRRIAMSVARVTEITSSSKKGFEDAIQKGIARADKTVRNITGAWIQEQTVIVDKGKIAEYRVNMKLTFVLE